MLLEGVITEVLSRLDIIRKYRAVNHDKDPIEHCKEDIPNQEMIVSELKRCADEIASTDLNFQAIWDMIEETQR